MTIYTIGYGGRDRHELLALLRANGVKTIVDIRLRPDRASMGIWVKARTSDKGIERWLNEAGIGYRSLIELGNVFLGCEDWKERYQRLLDGSGALLTERLKTIEAPMCLLCAEKRVAECHRWHVAEYAATHWGAVVQHLE